MYQNKTMKAVYFLLIACLFLPIIFTCLNIFMFILLVKVKIIVIL
jgi:hypothetical protein